MTRISVVATIARLVCRRFDHEMLRIVIDDERRPITLYIGDKIRGFRSGFVHRLQWLRKPTEGPCGRPVSQPIPDAKTHQRRFHGLFFPFEFQTSDRLKSDRLVVVFDLRNRCRRRNSFQHVVAEPQQTGCVGAATTGVWTGPPSPMCPADVPLYKWRKKN